MPKVWEEEGFRFYIYYNDHTPAHVHVEKAEGEVLIHIFEFYQLRPLKEAGKRLDLELA